MKFEKLNIWFLFGAKFIKIIKFAKPLITVMTALLSTVIYAFWMGPWFSIGFVLLLFIHEMGHIVAMRLKGMEPHGPVFIPFVGAAIFTPKFKDRDTEAFVGIGGPILGMVGALACFALWWITQNPVILLISYVAVYLNLFNLVPISPLDGGRITQAIGDWFKYIGLLCLLLYTVISKNAGMLLVWILILDNFPLPRWSKGGIGLLCLVAMAILFGQGFGGTWFSNFTDIVISAIFVMIYICVDIDYKEKTKEEDRPLLSKKQRTEWAIAYFGLTLVCLATIMVQIRYLPEIQNRNENQHQTTNRSINPLSHNN